MELPPLAFLWPSIFHLIFLFSITKTWLPPVANCLSNLGNETDRIALLEFKAQIFNDPYGVLSSWNDSAHFCRWEGVTCGRKHKRVTSLDLQGMSLTGVLSPYVSNLTFLRFINLANNRFHGEIPQQLGYLFRLRDLILENNTFGGEIPANISYCSNLRVIKLKYDHLAGKIPAQVGSLNNLVYLGLSVNELTGEIPHSLGNLTSLQFLFLIGNNLQGNIQNDLGGLTRLIYFQVSVNKLTGEIPPIICNLSSVAFFYVAANQLKGSIPPNIGLALPNLTRFAIGGNQITGSIPISFTNASQLQEIDIPGNKISGQVPKNLGYLKSLRRLTLDYNFLGRNTSDDLDFMKYFSNSSNLEIFSISQNNFGGQLPSSIANISTLVELRIGANQIYGQIPQDLGNLVNLYILAMTANLFSGPIPDTLGKLVKLQLLGLEQNKLSGEIPKSLCNSTQLYALYLNENKLDGNLTSIVNCKKLQVLDIHSNNLIGSIPPKIFDSFQLTELSLSQNALAGPIPLEIGSLKNINKLDLSGNKLSGKISETIGECLSLEGLDMGSNMLQGDIPSSLSSLKGLRWLDLSNNNFSGDIPGELENLSFLEYLNLSFNNLKGEVPNKGVFRNVSAFSFDRNNNLCGGVPELQLPICPAQGKKDRKSAKAIIIVATISAIVIFIAITSLYVSYKRKSKKNLSLVLVDFDKLPRVSYNELWHATGGFSSDNLIGEGSFGLVYKGNLDPQGERLVAVKVLKLQQHGAHKSFLAECKVLRNIRHKNLVKILTYCSSIDFKGIDFKALVFDFMENGSLKMWLHPNEQGSGKFRKLSLLQRLHVAVDVSSAMHYLHEHCETPIIHCDLKPSNILFDSDMTAHVSDFGLARYLQKLTNNSSRSESSTVGIQGTIGYVAPEYGVGSQATKYGDVYSFGIILLEIFTGMKPTDEVFTDGLSLHNYVKSKLHRGVMQVVDPVLIRTGDVGAALATSKVMDDEDSEIQEDDPNLENLRQDGGDHVHKCVISVLKIGLSCSAELPRDRMNMEDVSRKLNVLTEAFLRTRTRGTRRTVAH